ncbi:hypothetical protein Moror_17661 [Moniliophthora roreri MCA 2997]|uniref:Xylanolytic transcriptional activator regulatory domain-containing protein n=1 Tax=Moniliophthora roreri (strain MCA 2997) TaxID=1381753 RepID=V2XUN0_MONRO|nr:hypothetical protein Moror_17661 [Moniliophthora roreri MCA 2997]
MLLTARDNVYKRRLMSSIHMDMDRPRDPSGAGIGSHRRKDCPITAEGELLKRAFCVLVAVDVIWSTFAGRPRATSADDYDLELPVDCDDEYWEHEDPTLAFKQPPGKPSRTIFAIKRPQLLAERNADWKQQILSYLDKELIKWVNTIPDHRTVEMGSTPPRQDVLSSVNDHLRILLLGSDANPPSVHPSVVFINYRADGAERRASDVEQHVWEGRKVKDPDKGLAEVYRCLTLLQTIEDRYQVAGQLVDILSEMITKEDPSRIPSVTALKRRQTTDTSSFSNPFTVAQAQEPRTYAGSARVAAYMDTQKSQYQVPVYSSELGNIPVDGDWFSAPEGSTGVDGMGMVTPL